MSDCFFKNFIHIILFHFRAIGQSVWEKNGNTQTERQKDRQTDRQTHLNFIKIDISKCQEIPLVEQRDLISLLLKVLALSEIIMAGVPLRAIKRLRQFKSEVVSRLPDT